MTKEQAVKMAQRDADRTGKPHCVLNLNRFSPLYVVREWRDVWANEISAPRFVCRVNPNGLPTDAAGNLLLPSYPINDHYALERAAEGNMAKKLNSDLIMEAIAETDAKKDSPATICFVEYDWTSTVYKFRVGSNFTDFRGTRSWESMEAVKADLIAADCFLGTKTDSRTWPVFSGASCRR